MVQDESTSAFGLQANVAGGLAGLFSWLGGLIILLGKPPQAWVRFVAVQSIVLGIAVWIVQIALRIIMGTMIASGMWPVVGILSLISMLIGLLYIVACIATGIRGFQGAALRLPIIADIADKYVPASAKL